MGNTSGETLIELTRKTPAIRHASSVQEDISRFPIIDIGRKRQTDIGKEDIGLIQEDIRRTLQIDWQKTLGNTSSRHQLDLLYRHWQDRHLSSDISKIL